jgi:hypothetical protein
VASKVIQKNPQWMFLLTRQAENLRAFSLSELKDWRALPSDVLLPETPEALSN